MKRVLLLSLSVVVLAGPAAAATAGHATSDSPRASSSQSSRSTGSSSASHAASGASLGGAPIPGLCMLSQSWLLSNAKVARAADVRLKQLQQQIEAELGAEQTSIDNDARTLESQRASLSPADFQKRQAALQARVQAGRQKSQQRSNELAATRQKALDRISAAAGPIIAQSFRARGCSLLIDRNVVLLGNMTNDLTSEVVRNLDAKISTITFDFVLSPPTPARTGGN